MWHHVVQVCQRIDALEHVSRSNTALGSLDDVICRALLMEPDIGGLDRRIGGHRPADEETAFLVALAASSGFERVLVPPRRLTVALLRLDQVKAPFSPPRRARVALGYQILGLFASQRALEERHLE